MRGLILFLSLFIIISYSCVNKDTNYSFVKGVVLDVKRHHKGNGYFTDIVTFKFAFNNRDFILTKNAKNTYHLGAGYYNINDTIIVQIPDSIPEKAMPNRVVNFKMY